MVTRPLSCTPAARKKQVHPTYYKLLLLLFSWVAEVRTREDNLNCVSACFLCVQYYYIYYTAYTYQEMCAAVNAV